MTKQPKVIAFFDYDGTLSYEDSFVSFLKRVHPTWKQVKIIASISPLLAGYKANLVSARMMRSLLLKTLQGLEKHQLEEVGYRHARYHMPRTMRPEIFDKLEWHKSQGHEVVLVSASFDLYLKPWAVSQGFDHMIINYLEYENGRATGRVVGNEIGQIKAELIQERFDLSLYDDIYAYGDTKEDKPMLALANHSVYLGAKS